MINKRINKCKINLNSSFIGLFYYWIIRLFVYSIFGLLVCWIICLLPARAEAAGLSLAAYPPIVQIQTTAPDSIDTEIKLQNLSDTPLDLQIMMKPFTAAVSSDGGVSYLDNKTVPKATASFLSEHIEIRNEEKLPVQEIVLSPQQQRSLTMHVDLAKGDPPGDYYFSIVFLSKEAASHDANASLLSGGIATNVLISIGPKEKAQASIAQFSAPSFVQSGPVRFTVKLLNESDFFIVPKARILIKNMFGQIVGNVSLLPVNVLAHTARYIPDNSQAGNVDAVWPEAFLIGPYTATLTIGLSDTGPVYEQNVHFFALPIFIMGIIVVTIGIGIMICIRVRKKLKAQYG